MGLFTAGAWTKAAGFDCSGGSELGFASVLVL